MSQINGLPNSLEVPLPRLAHKDSDVEPATRRK